MVLRWFILLELATSTSDGKGRDVGEDLVKSLQNTKYSVDEKLDKTFINFFGKKTSASSATKLEDLYQSLPEGSDNEESQSGDDDENDEDNEMDVEGNSKMKQVTEIHGGRLRRKAIFKEDIGESHATEEEMREKFVIIPGVTDTEMVTSCTR